MKFHNPFYKVMAYAILAMLALFSMTPILAYAQPIALTDLYDEDIIVRGFIFFVAGGVGMVTHYVKKWLRDEIDGNLLQYMFMNTPKKSLLAISGLLSATLTALGLGQLETLTAAQLIMSAFTTGYACDSAFNGGSAVNIVKR